MSPLPPQRTPEQRDDARRIANATRQERARIKQRIKAGTLGIDEVIAKGEHGASDEIGEHARLYGGLKVGETLNAVPSVGKVKVEKAMAAANLTDKDQRLDTLTAHERGALLDWLEQHVAAVAGE